MGWNWIRKVGLVERTYVRYIDELALLQYSRAEDNSIFTEAEKGGWGRTA